MEDTQEGIELRTLYKRTVSTVPEVEHDENSFIEGMISAAARDDLRTAGLRRDLSSLRLDYKILKVFPLNDFIYGINHYLTSKGKTIEEARILSREIANRQELFESHSV